MAKTYYCYAQEWWPVLTLSENDDFSVRSASFSDEEIADLERVQREFSEWQEKLATRFSMESTQTELIEIAL